MPNCLHGHPDGESPLEEIDFLWIDSSRNGLSVEKFEGANSIFGEFKRGSSLKNGTCGSRVIDCSVESDDAEFLSKDLKALRILLLSVTRTIAGHIYEAETAKKAWETLAGIAEYEVVEKVLEV